MRPFCLIAVLLASLTASASLAHAQVYLPGVHEGDWLFYGDILVNSNVPPFLLPPEVHGFLQTTSIRTEVTSVAATNVTLSQQWANQTSVKNVTLQGDVKTGSGNLTYWIVAGGLSQSDPLTEAADSPVINSTLTRPYAGASRIVNLLRSTQPLAWNPTITLEALAYWDQISGALLELSVQVYGSFNGFPVSGSAHAKVTETNIWQVQPDFTIAAAPSSVSMRRDMSTFSNLTFASIGGYANMVYVLSTVEPAGRVQVTPATSTIFLGAGETRFFLLSINTTTTTPSGAYLVTVSATDSQSLTHYATITVQVSPGPPRSKFQHHSKPV